MLPKPAIHKPSRVFGCWETVKFERKKPIKIHRNQREMDNILTKNRQKRTNTNILEPQMRQQTTNDRSMSCLKLEIFILLTKIERLEISRVD